jgi:hypothetical protein
MNAQNNNQGFLGSSTFNNNRMLQGTIGAQQQAAVGQATAGAQAANLMGQANLQNVGTTAGLQMQDLANRANPALLANGLGAYGQALSSPLQALSSNYQAAQAPLNFFRIGNQAWQAQNMPTVYPQINGAQIAGGALSSLGTAANQYSQQQQQNALMQQLLGQYTGANPFVTQNIGGVQGTSWTPTSTYTPPLATNPTTDASGYDNLALSGLNNNSFGTMDPYSG